MTHLTLPYPPSCNRLWRVTSRGTYPTAEAAAFKAEAGWLAKAAGLKLMEGPIKLTVILHPKQPKRYKPGEPIRCLDLDNALKATIDALQGIAYLNDSQIVDIRALKGEPIPGGGLSVEVCRVAPYVHEQPKESTCKTGVSSRATTTNAPAVASSSNQLSPSTCTEPVNSAKTAVV
jgi:crossover junction endodeoxyribonuclease RusA